MYMIGSCLHTPYSSFIPTLCQFMVQLEHAVWVERVFHLEVFHKWQMSIQPLKQEYVANSRTQTIKI